jgi:alpha-L-fucosidase
MNDTWAFKTKDTNWKSVGTLLRLLVDLASKGVNYLLNVGPTAEGLIPEASVERLAEIGKWMKVNGEAIHGTSASPYPYEFPWGGITRKPRKVGTTRGPDDAAGRLYLLITEWPGERLTLYGLRSKVKKAYLLADREKTLDVAQTEDESLGHHELALGLPSEKPDEHVSVAVLEIEGEADVDETPLQQPDGTLTLPAHMAELHGNIRVDRTSAIDGWRATDDWLSWDFKVTRPGEFEVQVLTIHRRQWRGDHGVKVAVGGQELSAELAPDEKIESPRAQYFPEYASRVGGVAIAEAGSARLELRAGKIDPEAPGGPTVSAVRLVPKG